VKSTLFDPFSSLTPEEISSIALRNSWRAEPSAMGAHLSEGRFQRPRHVQAISKQIRKALTTPGSRTIITTPPQVGKTTTAVKWGSIWAFDLLQDPKIALCSYGTNYSRDWAIDIRDTIVEHAPTLGWGISPTKARAAQWATTEGGEFFSTSIDGELTGKKVDILFIDDPYKNWAQAYSEAYLDKVRKWWGSVAYTRLAPNAAVVLIMTRWNAKDLAGELIKKSREGGDQWDVINFPAIAGRDDPMGRAPGESLWPERYSVADYERIRANATELIWWPLYQGKPRASISKHFERLRYYEKMPDLRKADRIIQTWDLPQKDKLDSDWAAGQTWARLEEEGQLRAYLLDGMHEHAASPRIIQMVRGLYRRWPGADLVQIEDAAAGPSVYAHLRPEISVLDLKAAIFSKEVRAQAVVPFVEAGQVVVPDPVAFPWAAELIQELLDFPDADHDDQVDAATMAVTELLFEAPDVSAEALEAQPWISRWRGR